MDNIIMTNISKSYNKQNVLDNLSITIPSDNITCVVGPSGCGKTTLLRLLAHLDSDYTGTIVNEPSEVSFVFQENRLLPWLSAYDNAIFSVLDKPYHDEAIGEMDTLIGIVGLNEHIHKKTTELSGGMLRRIALLRAFISRATLLLLDEPFTGLDKEMKLQIARDLFLYAKSHNKTIVMVSHDEDIIALADHIVDMG